MQVAEVVAVLQLEVELVVQAELVAVALVHKQEAHLLEQVA